MKILEISHTSYPILGGGAIHVFFLSSRLAQNNKIRLITSNNSAKGFKRQNLEIYSYKPIISIFRNPVSPLLPFALLKHLKWANISHFHIIESFFTLTGSLISYLLKKPYIITVHGIIERDLFNTNLFSGLYRIYKKRICRFIVRHASVIIALTQKQKTKICKIYGISEQKIIVIPNAVNVSKLRRTPKGQFKRKFDLDPEIPIVTHISRLIPQKNPMMFLKAIYGLIIQDYDIRAVIVGWGFLAPRIHDFISNKGIKEKVLFLEKLPQNWVHYLLKDSEILVFPSILSEGFPTVILEAWASKTLVIAFNTEAINSIICHRKNGYLVKPEINSLIGAIQYVINQPEKKEKIVNYAFERARRHYDWRIITKRIEILLRNVID